jgi:hypothetical protein
LAASSNVSHPRFATISGTTFGISDEDQYNMDEKGFAKGIGDDVKVLVPVIDEEVFSI